jgi:hypothetical protein
MPETKHDCYQINYLFIFQIFGVNNKKSNLSYNINNLYQLPIQDHFHGH